ncbi:MAG: putative hydrolase of the HAD superfamily [Candidatus Pseudothioglobus sp.]|jgi:putative hydrolase of the HAD superfamily
MRRAIIFDLDETLIDRQETMRQFLVGQHQRLFDELAPIGETFVSAVLSHQNGGYADKQLAYELALSGYPVGPTLVDVLMNDFSENYGGVAVCFADVAEVLAQLQERFVLGLISNGRSTIQRRKLDSAKISAYFDAIVISEEVGVKKPDPSIFLHCLKLLDLSPEDAWYVGDHPVNDMVPAVKMGMRGIWVKNHRFPCAPSAHATVDHIRELLLLID